VRRTSSSLYAGALRPRIRPSSGPMAEANKRAEGAVYGAKKGSDFAKLARDSELRMIPSAKMSDRW